MLHIIIALLFVLSGGFGLTYRIGWFTCLCLFPGDSMCTKTIVPAAFGNGLALGAE
jgi:hypothetical protein